MLKINDIQRINQNNASTDAFDEKKKKNPAKCANKGHPCLKILQEKYFDQKYLLALFQLQTEVFH